MDLSFDFNKIFFDTIEIVKSVLYKIFSIPISFMVGLPEYIKTFFLLVLGFISMVILFKIIKIMKHDIHSVIP